MNIFLISRLLSSSVSRLLITCPRYLNSETYWVSFSSIFNNGNVFAVILSRSVGWKTGPQNPTPTSTSVRAGNRLTRVSQLYYIPRYRIQLGMLVWLTGEVVLGLPTLGVVGFGVPCWCGVGGPRPVVSALLASWFVHWVSIRS